MYFIIVFMFCFFQTSREKELERKFEGLRLAPLLDADRQNILSVNGHGNHVTSPSRRVGIFYFDLLLIRDAY